MIHEQKRSGGEYNMLYRVGRNTISDIASQLSGTGIVILASHNCHGEAELMSDLIKYNDKISHYA